MGQHQSKLRAVGNPNMMEVGSSSSGVQDESKDSTGNEMLKKNEDAEIKRDCDHDLLNCTEAETTLVQKILSNHLTLYTILKYVPADKNFGWRRMNRMWERGATPLIMNASENKLVFEYSLTEGRYHVLQREGRSKRPLSELNNCISSPRQFPCSITGRFPCTNFEIIDFVGFETEDMTTFLGLHGQEIKTLTWSEQLSSGKVGFLGKILVDHAPNVQSLSISERPTEEEEEEEGGNKKGISLFSENVVLPNLKFLSSNTYSGQSLEIVQAAPNLKELGGYVFGAFDALASIEKIHLVKKLRMCINSPESLQHFKKWAEAKPKLIRFSLSFFPGVNRNVTGEIREPLVKLLNASQESILEINVDLHPDLFNGDGAQWPSLTHVNSLSISNYSDDVYTFSPNVLFNTFPNITKLEIDSQGERKVITNFLTTAAQLPCLQILQMKNADLEWLNLLLRAAPNVEELTVVGKFDFFLCVGLIWKFKKLQKLRLAPWAGHPYFPFQFPQLDMAVTGLSEEMVRRLHEDPVYFEEMKMKGREIPRVTTSILDCKALKTFTLDVCGFGGYGNLGTWLTSVSGEFGFKLMSRVNAELVYTLDFEPAFQPLAPYLKLIVK